MEDAVVDGNQRARLDARLDPGPGDDTLAVARRAAVHLVVGASGRAHARGLEHDVGHRRGVVLGRHAAALAPDGLEQLADLLRLGSVVILLDVMERQTRHEGVGGLVRLQRGVEGRHREGRHDEEGERVVVSSALQHVHPPRWVAPRTRGARLGTSRTVRGRAVGARMTGNVRTRARDSCAARRAVYPFPSGVTRQAQIRARRENRAAQLCFLVQI